MSKLIFTQLKKMNEKKLFYSMQFLGVEPLLFDTLYKIHVHIHVHQKRIVEERFNKSNFN